MSLDTDPIMEPYNHRAGIFFENADGSASAGYNDDNNKRVNITTNIKIYSDIIQKLHDNR
ncbi:hypothetical protein D3C77_700110 [compost metagenome]